MTCARGLELGPFESADSQYTVSRSHACKPVLCTASQGESALSDFFLFIVHSHSDSALVWWWCRRVSFSLIGSLCISS